MDDRTGGTASLRSSNIPCSACELSLSDLTISGPQGHGPSSFSFNAPKAWKFGDNHDGIIESVAFLNAGGAVEMGYYYGDDKPKSILKVSSQAGCPAKCIFCEEGEEEFIRSLEAAEMYDQAVFMLEVAGSEGIDIKRPHKVNFAGTGEPFFNDNLPETLQEMSALDLSFKISTIFPRGDKVRDRFERVARFAAAYDKPVQIQISLVSTSEEYRREAIGIPVASFDDIVRAGELWRSYNPARSQINMSLILTEHTPADPEDVLSIFPPEHFRFRFRNYVPTQRGKALGLVPISGERMKRIKELFRESGYLVTDDATPTPVENEFGLASNVTLRRVLGNPGESR